MRKAIIILLLIVCHRGYGQEYRFHSIGLQISDDIYVLPTIHGGFIDSSSGFGFDYRLSYAFAWANVNQVWLMTGLQYRAKYFDLVLYPVWYKREIGKGYITPTSAAIRYKYKNHIVEGNLTAFSGSKRVSIGLRVDLQF